MKEEILNRIAEFDAKPLAVKNIILHQAQARQEENDLNAEILRAVGKGSRASIVGVIHHMAVVETRDFEEAPFQACIYDGERWFRCSSCWPTIEQALLDAMGTRAEGINSRFAYYAWAMIAEDRR
ncbi:MAG: hypothetical protein EOM03_12270 [Clostridia bacterium]|nr:hypothetical protein [Clostridia bacterium]